MKFEFIFPLPTQVHSTNTDSVLANSKNRFRILQPRMVSTSPLRTKTKVHHLYIKWESKLCHQQYDQKHSKRPKAIQIDSAHPLGWCGLRETGLEWLV
jgi:hypothetical protein